MTTTTLHSKRFAAAADQLRQLRTLLETYIAAHWRNEHTKGLEARRAAGAKLLAAQPPQVRLDFSIQQAMLMVDRAFANQATPALPDALARLDGHHGA